MQQNENIDHLIRLARSGSDVGSSGGEKKARQIVQALLDAAIDLDETAIAGIGELATQLYAKGFRLRDVIRGKIAPDAADIHYLELRDEPSGLRHYLEGKPLHAGDLIAVLTEAGWCERRYNLCSNRRGLGSVL